MSGHINVTITARSGKTGEVVCSRGTMQEVVDALCEMHPDARQYVEWAKKNRKTPLVQMNPFLDYYDIEIGGVSKDTQCQ